MSAEEEPRRILVQAVHEVFDRQATTAWESSDDRINRLVFIGKTGIAYN